MYLALLGIEIAHKINVSNNKLLIANKQTCTRIRIYYTSY